MRGGGRIICPRSSWSTTRTAGTSRTVALARAKGDKNREYYIGRFDFESQPTNVAKEDGLTPLEVHLFFLVPENTAIKTMNYQDAKVTDVTVAAPPATKPA